MTNPSVDFMESLYEQEKELDEDIIWQQNKNNPGRYTTRARVVTVDRNEILTLCGEKWPKGYSFVIRYKNYPIRVWDFNDHHEGISGGHKHQYTGGKYRGDDPYSVNDVSTTNVNQALIDFLDECKIRKGDATIDKIQELDNYG